MKGQTGNHLFQINSFVQNTIPMPLKCLEPQSESLTEDESQCETRKGDYSKKKDEEALERMLEKEL